MLDPAPSWPAEAGRRAEHRGVSDRGRTVEGTIDDLEPTARLVAERSLRVSQGRRSSGLRLEA